MPEASLERRKQAAAQNSMLVTLVMTAAKLSVGLLTGSLAILADAIQSSLDLVSTTITLFAVRFSARPPDADHPFGHGKFENVSALLASGVLLTTAGWIVVEAVQRLAGGVGGVRLDPWAFVVVLVSMVVDLTRSRALKRVARETGSQALAADALNFETDIWSSVAVLVGLLGVLAGEATGVALLLRADALAAIVVAGFIVFASFRLMRETLDVLTDRVEAPLADRIAAIALAVPGVLSVVRVRARRGGPTTFVDLVVTADRLAQFVQSHELTEQIERAIERELPRADVVVHVEPEAMPDESLQGQVLHAARLHGLAAHDVQVREVVEGAEIDLHLEVPRELTLAEAYERASHLETDLRRTTGLVAVNVHLEAPHPGRRIQKQVTRERSEVVRRLHNVTEMVAGPGSCREIRLYQSPEGGGLDAVVQLALPGDLNIDEAHTRTEEVELALRRAVAALRTVLIRTAPRDETASQTSCLDPASPGGPE